jgi:hypothetical protein
MNGFEQILTIRQLKLIVSETIALIPGGLVVEGEIQKVRVYKDSLSQFAIKTPKNLYLEF